MILVNYTSTQEKEYKLKENDYIQSIYNPIELDYIITLDQQTEYICLKALDSDARCFRNIVNKTDDIIEKAINIYPYNIQYVEEQTDKLCALALKYGQHPEPDVFKLIRDPSVNICILAVQCDIHNLIYVPSDHMGQVLEKIYPQGVK